MTKVFQVIFILLVCSNLQGQTRPFLSFAGTYPIMTDFAKQRTVLNMEYTLIGSYETKPGIDFTVGFQSKLFDKLGVDLGLGLSYIQFKQSLRIESENKNQLDELANQIDLLIIRKWKGEEHISDSLQIYDQFLSDKYVVNESTNVGQTRILYFNIPISVHYSIIPDKFRLSLGLNFSILATSTQKKMNSIGEYNDKSIQGLSNKLILLDVSFQYKVLKRVFITTSYSHSLTSVYDINKNEIVDTKYKILKMGLNFTFM